MARTQKLTDEEIKLMYDDIQHAPKQHKAYIARYWGISRQTMYKYIKEIEKNIDLTDKIKTYQNRWTAE